MDFGGKMPLFCPLQECSILKLQSVSFPTFAEKQCAFSFLHLCPPSWRSALSCYVDGVQRPNSTDFPK